MDFGLKNKVALITGSAQGIGKGAAEVFAELGCNLVLFDLKEETLKSTAAMLEQKGVGVLPLTCDVSNESQIDTCMDIAIKRWGRIDVLINCAGMHSTTRTLTKAGFETVFCVNHLASFLLTHLLLDRMKESAPSRILQVNSEGHRFNGLDPDDLDWKKRHYTGLRSYGAS